jgi:hypothetical protein
MKLLYIPTNTRQYAKFSHTTVVPKDTGLLEQVSHAIRLNHYSYRTEQTYKERIKYTLFHVKPHPKDMSVDEIRSFLSHLASEKNVATSTQNQATSPQA